MQIIKVECYSGYRADERPVNFIVNGRKLVVQQIMEQWRSPDSEYYKVLADDRRVYLIMHDNGKDHWILKKAFEH